MQHDDKENSELKKLSDKNKKNVGEYTPEWVTSFIRSFQTKDRSNKIGDLVEAFYYSEHGQDLDPETLMLVDTDDEAGETVAINEMRHTIDLWIAQLTGQTPIPMVAPYPDDDELVNEGDALVMNGIITRVWDKDNLLSKIEDAVLEQKLRCIGIMEVYFDKSKGKTLLGLEESAEYGFEEAIKEGEVVSKIIDTRKFYPDPTAKSVESMRYYVVKEHRSTTFVEREFSLPVGCLDPYKGQEKYTDSADARHSRRQTDTFSEVHGIDLYEVVAFTRDGKHLGDKTIRMCMTDKHILHYEMIDRDEIHLHIYTGKTNVRSVGMFYYNPSHELVKLQRKVNKSETVIIENIEMAGHVKYQGEENSLKNTSGIIDDVQFLEIKEGAKPISTLAATPLPHHLTSHPQRIINHMRNIKGISAVSASQIGPRGAGMSASLGTQLTSAESVYHARELRVLERFIVGIIRSYFYLMRKHYNEERVLNIVGGDMSRETVRFVGTELTRDFEVEVSVGVALNNNPAESRTELRELLFANRITMEQYQSARDNYGHLDTYQAKSQIRHWRKAKRNVAYIESDTTTEDDIANLFEDPNELISPFEDAKSHLELLKSYIATAKYETLEKFRRVAIIAYAKLAYEALIQSQQMFPPQQGDTSMQGQVKNNQPLPPNGVQGPEQGPVGGYPDTLYGGQGL